MTLEGARPLRREDVSNRKVYFRLRLQNVLAFAKNGSWGRDPSRTNEHKQFSKYQALDWRVGPADNDADLWPADRVDCLLRRFLIRD